LTREHTAGNRRHSAPRVEALLTERGYKLAVTQPALD